MCNIINKPILRIIFIFIITLEIVNKFDVRVKYGVNKILDNKEK